MEKNARTSLIFLLLLAGASVPFLSLRAAEQVVIHRQASEEYRHPETELTFPARVETFEKVMVRINPDPEIGVGISYENETGSLADVYIYRNAEPFDEHAEKTFRRILDTPKKSKLIRACDALDEPETAEGVFIARFRMAVEGETLISRLILFEKNGYYVKIRITVPETAEQEDDFALRFAEAMLKLKEKTEKPSITSGAEK